MNATGFPLDESGMWREIRVPSADASLRPVLFIDRDGTLIELVDYLSSPDDVRPIAEAVALTARARAMDMPTVMVTNQSGIGRGYYGWRDFAAVQQAVIAAVAAGGGRIDAVYACPALPDSGAACRKPNPGMLLAAADDLALDLRHSWIVGDTAGDMAAGAGAGLRRGWLVATGYGVEERGDALALRGPGFDVTVDRPLRELADLLSGLSNA
ncbi:MAG: HAD-IIIA family hydrolase [Alphaproteobacteria bacterium]|nr:HAD-IIIA family hydrolase [Alphaproteobacteria bacterium]MDP6589154.1 HAD-IIIA family hydrolase [Alphaproteobacteria bacterium]MDP6816487.1 HAD-IIIA family hydrolase [Alphaproteobacteria bacterium]